MEPTSEQILDAVLSSVLELKHSTTSYVYQEDHTNHRRRRHTRQAAETVGSVPKQSTLRQNQYSQRWPVLDSSSSPVITPTAEIYPAPPPIPRIVVFYYYQSTPLDPCTSPSSTHAHGPLHFALIHTNHSHRTHALAIPVYDFLTTKIPSPPYPRPPHTILSSVRIRLPFVEAYKRLSFPERLATTLPNLRELLEEL